MKIVEAKIYGFGKWVDYTIQFSNHSPICVFGENEAGKSTLQEFILFVLFGLAPKRRAFYRPKTSSKMGGRLTLKYPSLGNVLIERLDGIRNGAAVCYTEDGQEHDETWLNEQLNGMTEDIYKSIYSFDAGDLSAIQHMKQEEIGDVLLGVGLTGSARIHTIEKQLDAKIGELFKPYGVKPIINEQLAKLDDLIKDAQHFKEEEQMYHHKIKQRTQLEKDQAQLQTLLREHKERVNRLEKELQALPYAHEFKGYLNQLDQLPKDIPFPQNGIERLNTLKENQLPLQSQLSILKSDEKKYLQEKEHLELALTKMPSIKGLETIVDLKPTYLNYQQELKRVNVAIHSLEQEIENALNDLNLGIHMNELESIQLPFHTEKLWNELKMTESQLKIENEQLIEEQQTITSKQAYLKKKITLLQEEKLTDDQRNQLEEQVEELNENEFFLKFKKDINETKTKWDMSKRKLLKRQQSILFSSIIGGISFFLLYFITDHHLFRNVAAVCLVGGITFWGWAKFSLNHFERFFPDQVADHKVSASTMEEQREAKRLIAQDDELKSDEKSINAQLRNLDIQAIQYDEKKKSWENRKSRFQEQIKEQYRLHPYLSKIAINYWLEFYHTFKNIIRLHRNKNELEIERQQWNEKSLHISTEIKNMLHNEPVDVSTYSVEQQFDLITQYLSEAREKQFRIKQLEGLTSETAEYCRKLSQKKEPYDDEMAELFKIADVPDEDSFYKKATELQNADQLKASLVRIKEQISTLFSTEEWEMLIENLPKQSTLELEIEEMNKTIINVEEELDRLRQTRADIRAELVRIETSETYSKLMYRLDIEKDELNDLAREWAVLKTAKEILTETKWRYRDKYLNQVLERTTIYFKELTNNRYTRIFTPEDGKPFLVETNDSIRYTVKELSQGTINQLYVCLRLAISEVMNKHHIFPFIIDDAFVHFDGERMKRILQILKKQARDQQFIIFTCKEEIAACFGHANLIDLKKNISHV